MHPALGIKHDGRNYNMDRKYGFYIVVGMLVGAIFGMGLGAASGNAYQGMGIGALAGVFVGWFIAAAALNRGK